MNCSTCQKPNEDILILTSKFWIVTLSSDQAYLGRSYITLNRHCGSLSELEEEEWFDFIDLTKKLESTYKKAFDATLFNWSCLMNNAYQEAPPNPHVHWHFRPRYDHVVNFAEEQFIDSEFGHHYNRDREQRVTPKVREAIIFKIKEHI